MSLAIRFEAVTKRYLPTGPARRDGASHRPVFSEYSFSAKAGEKVAIVGANGVGKTTLLKLAGGFLQPEQGTVWLGTMVAHRSSRESVGLMLSTQLLYGKLSGLQNLELSARLFLSARGNEAIRKSVEFWKLGVFIEDKVETYSNGRRAMLALARATLHAPSVVLLDEPSAYLDEGNLARLLEFLRTTKATVLLTTQNAQAFHSVVDRVEVL